MKMTDYLAIYAAVLSTIVFSWNVLQSRPRLRIELVFGVEKNDGNTSAGACIIVRNISNHDIHLASVGYLYTYREPSLRERIVHLWHFRRLPTRIGWVNSSLSYHNISNGCPVTIKARKSHRVFIPESAIRSMLAKASSPALIAHAQDELWKSVYSQPLDWSFEKKAQK